MPYQEKTFQGETIRLDNQEYVNCVFIDCDMQYGGAGSVEFSNCRFDRCRWSFVDAASNTLHFMASLYHGLGEGGRNLMEDLFNSIRKNPPPGMGAA